MLMPMPFVRASVVAALLMSQTPARAADDPSKTVIDAAVTFSVGYGGWLWEKHCKTLPPAKGREFDALVQDVLKRLQEASDPTLVNAAVGGGRDVANDPKFSGCTGKDMAGFAQFGLDQVRDVDAKLKTLPAGFHLKIKD